MNSIPLLVFIIGVVFFAVAITLVYAIRRNFQTGMVFREQYREKISQLRFGQMIIKHGNDVQTLLHSCPIIDIEKQIKNCHSCLKSSECDVVLEKEMIKQNELAFCPNHSALVQNA